MTTHPHPNCPLASLSPSEGEGTNVKGSCPIQHWSDTYLGLPYIMGEFDCANLAANVQREIYGREIALPRDRAHNLFDISAQIDDLKSDYAERTESPQDGDAVLMIGRGRLNHIGVVALINGECWVLHAMRNAGQVVRHRVRDLAAVNLTVEGYYRWK